MSKQQLVDKLVLVAYRVEDKANRIELKTKKLKEMASLAKQGLKDSPEFRKIERELSDISVNDFSNEIDEIQVISKQLRRF